MPRYICARIGFIVLLLGAVLSPRASAGNADDIEVVGVSTISADAVRAHVKTSGGDADDAGLDAALRSIMSTQLFADARIERKGRKKLVVTVVENPIIAKVTIVGASAIDKKQIEQEIKLKARERQTQSRMHADALRIRDLYRRRGRLATTAVPSVASLPDGRVDVLFTITEGAVTKVDSIAFDGAKAFTAAQLRDVISTSLSSWLDILKTAAFYDRERVESDRDLIRRYYANNGFPDAQVTAAKAELNAQGTGYAITFTIDEGERYVFGDATIASKIDGFDANSVASAIKIRTGAAFNRTTVDQSLMLMTEMLSKHGQPFGVVEADVHKDRAKRSIALVFRITAGKPLYVERIDISGNIQTKDYVIRRELRVAEGDPINTYMVEIARARIKALGFFQSVDMKLEPGSAPDRARLAIVVTEQETGKISFGVGYSTSEGVVGDISWTENNLFGNGQYLQIKLSGSLVRLQADVGFTEPHLLGTNFSGGFDLFYKDTDYTQQASYKDRRVGGDVRLGFAISDQVSASVNYTFVRNTLYSVGPLASAAIREAIPGFPTNTSSSYNTSSVGYGVAYDTRDNKKHPTSGIMATTSQDFAGVGGDVKYIRSLTELRAYYAVTDTVTVMGRARGGVISGWGGQDVRLLDLFYKGSETVRGFAPAGIGPRDLASANQDALGGKMYAAATAETMFQLPGVPKDLGLSGAAFVDAGSLWGANKTAAALPGIAGSAASLRASVGVGLAWDSPLGPLRADYAIPILKQAFDKTQPFSFGLAP